MEKKLNEMYNKRNEYNTAEKTHDKIHNQSTEILQTEDIFINQKEEIKKIKKKRLEFKKYKFNQDNTKGLNLKCIQIRREKKFNTINELNLTETKKLVDLKESKSNSIKNKNNNKITKKFIKNNTNIKKLKIKLSQDIKHKDNKENSNNKKTQIIEDDNPIIINENYIQIQKELNAEKEIDFISLNNTEHFQKCDCIINEEQLNDLYLNPSDYDEIPIINEKWANLNKENKAKKLYPPNKTINHNFDFSRKVLVTKNVIDYNTKGVKINLHLKLYDKGIFWIFTRCYVNDYMNYIKRFKTISANSRKINIDIDEKENMKNKMFNKYSTVIKIFKNRNSNKAFVSFGTFYKNKKSGNLHYKTFLQRQLVDFVHEDNNYYYLENDLCEFDVIIVDLGNECLQTKISLNNREKYNNIKSNFYLPINKKAKLMFCGEGNNIKITHLDIKSFIKLDEDRDKIGLILTDEKKACDCCNVF